MNKVAALISLLIFAGLSAFCQTPGLIYKTAGVGATVLDPNSDGYTSATVSGFIANDQTESEIPYRALIVPAMEPNADPGAGPDCGFTDIVDSGSEDPVFTFLDAQSNLLFRFRIGSTADNSKGYSILIDTDQKFGFTGSQADPNAVSGNPGFEIEIVLRTNLGVSLYDVDGTISPVLKTTLSYDDYAQKSIALSTNCGNADYFYDFFIPFNIITSYFPSVTTSTPVRLVSVTSISPAPAIGNNAVSDVGGINDQTNGYSYDNIFQIIIDNYYPTSISDAGNGNGLERSAYPTIDSPIIHGATTISGSSTEIGSTIKIYTGSTEPYTLIGTTTVNANGSWAVTVPAVSTGDVIRATATSSNEGESYYSPSVIVTDCSTPIAPYNLTREANRKYISGTGTPGATIKVYLLSSGSYVQQSGSFILDPTGSGSFCWVPGINANSCTPPNGAGTLVNGTTYYISQTLYGCESPKTPICVDNQVSTPPTLTQTVIYTTTTTLSGTSGNGAAIVIYANGLSIATTTAIGTSWTATVDLTSQVGKYITVGAIDGTRCMAIGLSAAVLVQSIPVTSTAPVITGNYCATSTGSSITLSGTSSEENGSIVTLYINNVLGGTTTVFIGTWAINLTVKAGDVLTATAMGTEKSVSAISNSVTVNLSGAAPVVTFEEPIVEGSTSISGSFSGSGTLKVYIDGTLLGSTTSNTFTISGLSVNDLYAGGLVTATINSGGCESAMSTGITVSCLQPASTVSITPTEANVCFGLLTKLILIQSENGIIYQLYNGTSPTGSSVLGNGKNTSLFSDPLTADAIITIKGLKVSSASCATIMAQTQTVTITKAIINNVVSAPAVAVFCQSGTPDIIIGSLPGGGNGAFTYQWLRSNDNINFLNVPGATSKDYIPGTLLQTTYFKRIATSGACQSITSTSVAITVENTAIANSISSSIPTTFTDSTNPSITGNDAGSGITYQWLSSSDNILFTGTAITSKDYNPAVALTDTAYFKRLATNGTCSSESNTVSYLINHSPVITDFSKSGLEDSTLYFSSTDFINAFSDADGQALFQILIEEVPSHGKLWIDGNELTNGSIISESELSNILFTPNNNYNGLDSFAWKGYDGLGYSNASTVNFNLSAVNDAPQFLKGADQFFQSSDETVTVNSWATQVSAGPADEATQSLSFIMVNDNTNLFLVQPAIDSITGNLTFTVNPDASGVANVNVQLKDNGGIENGGMDLSGLQSFSITISKPDNFPPVVSNGNATISIDENSKNGTNVYSLSATDADGDTLTYTIVSGNASGAFVIDSNTGTISVSDSSMLDYEFTSEFTLTIKISDGVNEIETLITVLLNNLNDNVPVVTPEASVTLDENSATETMVYIVSASDADDNTLSYSIVSGNDSGAFAINPQTGGITVNNTTALDYETNQQFVLTVQVSDGLHIKTVLITINLNDLSDTLVPASPLTTTVITVQLRDANGNIFTGENENVSLLTSDGTLSNMIDLGSGVYQATLTSSTTAGIALITGVLNGESITDNEEVTFTEIFVPVYTMTVTADWLSIPADGLSASTIIISVTDQKGQPIIGLNIDLTTSAGSLGDITDNGDGTYSVVLTSSTIPGIASINVSADSIAESKTIEIAFTTLEPDDFFIPEGFSPDGDGVNDMFVIRGAEALTISLKVYDRSSNLIYEKLPYKNDWDGLTSQGKLPDGTYFYVVHVIDTLRQYVRYFTIKRK
jgi:gliding motility-associated-like protein